MSKCGKATSRIVPLVVFILALSASIGTASAQEVVGVEEAATEQNQVLRNGRDLARLARLIERQRQLSEEIGKIESGITPLREYWERIRDTVHGTNVHGLARTLDELLDELAERIHVIVEIEKENSRELLGTISRG